MAEVDRKALGDIAERIRRRRRELEMRQEDLATKAELSKSYVSEIESGSVAANGLIYLRIAEALDVPVQWVLTGDVLLGHDQDQSPLNAEVITIPPLVSEMAEELRWSHKRTLDVAAALCAVAARRTQGGKKWEPSRELILRVAGAIADEEVQ